MSHESNVTHPIVLIDEPWDGYMEEIGWVEATVTEGKARGILTEFCCDEDGEMGRRPVGPASREWLRPEVPLDSEDYGDGDEVMWHPAKPDDDGALEFWKVIAA